MPTSTATASTPSATPACRVLYAASSFSHLANFHLPYIEALMRDGYEVTLLAGADGHEAQMPEGAQLVPVTFAKKMGARCNFKVASQVRRMQLERPFDLVLTHTSLAAFFVRLGLLQAAMGGKAPAPRVVNTVHGYLFDDSTSFVKGQVMLAAEKLCAPVTSDIVVMNRCDAEIAGKHHLCQGTVFATAGMGCDLSGLVPATSEQRAEARRALGIDTGALVLVCAAEFSARKNQRMLIEAMPDLPANVLLVLPGKGALLEDCRALADKLGVASRVRFPGQLDAAGLVQWRAAGDVCVSASRYEGLPCHVVESFACGLPAVLSRVKGHEDLVHDGAEGQLFRFDDKAAFAEAIGRLANTSRVRTEMGRRARKASAAYDLQVVMPALMGFYEK